ncbi:hypothetical protein Tsubulata_038637 [Turnera subulata]|uniref:Myb-like domain-containing protein n=1 Tax=Turnera subulata TaxID=218843 RepID=A0A9Q0J1H0_9ROSI|nr:hypothetical protein Tsubulata_038637 [Turnera subulata]
MEKKEVKPRVKKGFWKPEEDLILKTYVETHGEGKWATVSQKSGINRNDVNDGNPQKTDDKRPGPESNSPPISSASPVTTNTEELNGKKQDKEECTVAESWLRNAQSMNFYVESPAVQANNARFIFDDEPFTPYLDSFVLFE